MSAITFSTHRFDVLGVVRRSWKTAAGAILPFALLPLALSDAKETRCGYVLALMACFWMLECIPIAATALLPVALFPLLGIMSTEKSSTPYMKATNMMFLGGLLMAIAVENSNLHKRIALKVLLWIGTSIRRIMLGIMLTTMFLSMWISNTASTAMMIPIVESMLEEIRSSRRASVCSAAADTQTFTVAVTGGQKEGEAQEDHPETVPAHKRMERNIRQTLLLSVAYAANIGGTGTLTGTGTNLILQGQIEDFYPGSGEVTFASWFYFAAPGMLICVVLAWLLLYLVFLRNKVTTNKNQEQAIGALISKKYEELGAPRFQEKAVGALFLVVVFLWLFREPKFITGWAHFLPGDTKVKDATPVILIALVMFLIPAEPGALLREGQKKPKHLLDWSMVQSRLPWGVLLLLGGGLALAEGTKVSGLSTWLGHELTFLNRYSPRQAMCAITICAAFLTEITSNVATASVILPVINQIALTMGANPLLLMVPVTVAISFAFMLPVATPPNALVFEAISSKQPMKAFDMIKPGFAMNVLCIGVQLALINTWGVFIFNLNQFPQWAQVSLNGTTAQ